MRLLMYSYATLILRILFGFGKQPVEQIAGFPCLVCVSHDPANVPGGAKYWHFRHIPGLVRIVLGFVVKAVGPQ